MTAKDIIEKAIKDNDVFLFMKGNPQAPMCGFSAATVEALNATGAKYASFDVLSNNEVREEIKAFSNWPTIPQLYVKGEFVGGCDIVREMFQSGDLQKLIEK